MRAAPRKAETQSGDATMQAGRRQPRRVRARRDSYKLAGRGCAMQEETVQTTAVETGGVACEARPLIEGRAFPWLDDVFDSLPSLPVNLTQSAFEAFRYDEIIGSIRVALREAEGRIAAARNILVCDLGMLDPASGAAAEAQTAVDSLQVAEDVIDTASAVLDRWPNTFSGSRVVCLSDKLWRALRGVCPPVTSAISVPSILAAGVKALASRADRNTLILAEEFGPNLGAEFAGELGAPDRGPTAIRAALEAPAEVAPVQADAGDRRPRP